jgi:hypothetical protein
MGMTSSLFRAAALLLSLMSASVAIQVDSVKTDLKPLIRAASENRVQFAVHVPHRLSLAKDGQWTNFPARARSEWRYAIRIPTAVSMSFYASQIHLPAHTYLTVRSARTTIVYQSSDLRQSDLWSRVQPGDSLEFALSVPSAERGSAKLEIEGFQAGYRALGSGVKDHPYFQQLKQQLSVAVDNTGCIQNYQCNVTTGNALIAAATVGVVIQNVYQCTGTLVNDVPGDNTPYILTARHCENGAVGGGAPSNAANLTVYWDATTPCGSTLGSIYDPGIATQTGATTIVEQQDAWLVKLDESPAVTDAQFAGIDASGAALTGGYTVHHALGHSKQFTQWFGQAYLSQQSDVLGSNYVSNFLETVNQLGNVGPGASGSGLIDGHDRLVGTLTLGRKSDDPIGYESCPVNPAAPNGSNGAADFTSLAAVWNSTADLSLGPAAPTLKSVLDPGNTGTLIIASTTAAHLNFTASSHSLIDGDSLTLSWDAAGATQCIANGGANSDGWSGTLPGSGHLTLTETFGGTVSYGLSCQLSGGRVVNAVTKVFWSGSVPSVFLDSFSIVWTGANATLTWSSNVAPCAISGGSLALSNLPSSGSTTTTENTPGDVKYIITCGSSPTATGSLTETYVTPALTFRANGTDRRSGEPLWLYWASYAQSCIPAGGAAGDGWTNSTLGPANQFSPRVTVLGTYTYTLTCFAGPNQVSASVTVTLENNAPYTTASINPTTVLFSDSPADYLSIGWKTNLSSCLVNSNPNTLDGESTTYPLLPSGASDAEDVATYSPRVPGTYIITVTCTSEIGPQNATSAAPITVNVLPPPPPTVTISSSPSTVVQGQNFTMTWSSTNAQNCMATGSGGLIGVFWEGALSSNGSQVEGAMFGGQATLGITCQSIDPNQGSVSAQTAVSVTGLGPQPTVALSVNPISVADGQTFTLTWSSTNANSCYPNGGGAGETGWSGILPASGSLTQTASVEGNFTYTLTCSSAGGSNVQTQATLTVTAASTVTPPPPAASGGKSGGGGAMETRDLILLAMLLGLACMRGKSWPTPPTSRSMVRGAF